MPNSNEYMARYMSDRYLRLKIEAIEDKGGKCQRCGYDKCYAAMEFHHRKPNKKEASWNKLRKLSRKKIKAELDKCDLLCANCHREAHFDSELLGIQKRHEERHEERQPKQRETQRCEGCQKEFQGPTNQRFCSHGCAQKDREKIDWPDDLPDLVSASSMRAVARQLDVSDKAVKKRLTNHFGTLV